MIMRIKELRKASGMTQLELSRVMGCDRTAITSWEREIALPKARDLPLLAQVLECSIDDLYIHEDETMCEDYDT